MGEVVGRERGRRGGPGRGEGVGRKRGDQEGVGREREKSGEGGGWMERGGDTVEGDKGMEGGRERGRKGTEGERWHVCMRGISTSNHKLPVCA